MYIYMYIYNIYIMYIYIYIYIFIYVYMQREIGREAEREAERQRQRQSERKFLLAKLCSNFVSQIFSPNLQKYLNDFSKSVVLDWCPLNDLQDTKAMYLNSTTCSMSRMFSWFLEMENKALERRYRSTFKAASECKCEGSIVCKPLTYEIRLMSLVISTLVKDSRLANFRSSS